MNGALISLETRALEWFASLVMLAWALTLCMPGSMLAIERFHAFRTIPIGDAGWAALFATAGFGRLIALYINGRSPKTPYYRMVFASFGFIVWGFVTVALAAPILSVSDWHGVGTAITNAGPGFMNYGLICTFELFSVYRARMDSRYAQHAATDARLARLASDADAAIAGAATSGAAANGSRG